MTEIIVKATEVIGRRPEVLGKMIAASAGVTAGSLKVSELTAEG